MLTENQTKADVNQKTHYPEISLSVTSASRSNEKVYWAEACLETRCSCAVIRVERALLSGFEVSFMGLRRCESFVKFTGRNASRGE